METFEQLAHQHLDALIHFARGLARNPADADDLVQESCLRAFRNFRNFRPGSNFRAWLFTILRNVAINQHKRRRNRGVELPMEHLEPLLVARHEHSAVDGSQSFTSTDLRRAIRRLPAEYRDTLTLAYIEGYTYAEVARLLDCPIGTVMSRIFRARRRLRLDLTRAHRRRTAPSREALVEPAAQPAGRDSRAATGRAARSAPPRSLPLAPPNPPEGAWPCPA